MTKISDKKIHKLKEEILYTLFEATIKPLYTSHIADKIIRDEEFTHKLLKELKNEGLIEEVNKNTSGKPFIKRRMWILKPEVYSAYKTLSND